MPLQKILFKPGVNRENTRYSTEGGWYSCDKVRFRQGTPEKLGGWEQISPYTYEGVCRSLWTWGTITVPTVLTGVGTNKKFYIEEGGGYNDITPIREYAGPLSNPFVATTGSTTITVTDTAHGCSTGDYVSFIGAQALSTQTFTRSTATDFVLSSALANNTPVLLSVSAGGSLPTGLLTGVVYYIRVVAGTTVNFANVVDGAAISTSSAGSGTFSLEVDQGITSAVLNSNFAVTVVNTNSYTITASVAATAYDVGGGGTAVRAAYEVPVGNETVTPLSGWGAGAWGSGPWGIGTSTLVGARLWYQNNFGEDLIFGYRGSALYYWNAKIGTTPQVFTVTIASPGVVTFTSSELIDGTAVVLETTGALPTGLTVGTVYYVVNAVSNVCNLAATPGGAAITTTGAQSGTHYVSPRGIPVTSLAGASDVPVAVNNMTVSDVSRFVFAFGCNPLGETEIDPMFIRWSDQESVVNWTPAVTNQAGGVRLSQGSEIRSYVQTRQEIVVFTDASVYSLQYLGPPYVWGAQLLGDNTSIAGINTAITASGIVYWMGVDKFYRYDGRVQTLRCDLRQYIYSDINLQQQDQFFSGTDEGFNEVWWFYCSANSTVIDRYVVYNYAEDIWYYGMMGRTAWIDSGLNEYPMAATYSNNLVYHELGVDDNVSGTPVAIDSYITSSEFDIGDGHNIGFVWRLIPDVTFRGSTAASPQVTMTLLPMQNSGSGYNVPESVGGQSNAPVVRSATVPIEQFTGQVYIRVRGRQMSFKVAGNQLGLQWQLGAPRIDIKPDGRR
jgi:hypothetical protein